MPIIGWLCSGCGGRQVPLDHFATTKCGESVVHPDYAAALLADRRGHYASGVVEVSHGLGCPRRYAIEQSEDYWIDPLQSNSALTGTAWHKMMEANIDGGGKAEVQLSGVIAGIKVHGKTDRIRGCAVEDHKHISDWNLKYIRAEPVKPEHIAQESLYAELAEQSGLSRPTKGRTWYHTTRPGKDALVPVENVLMTVEEALAVKPYGGSFTVHQLLRQADSTFNSTPLGPDLNYGPVSWNLLPLAGSTMSFGSKSMCDYCQVRDICTQAENGAPF